jgi:hypothetical protein
MKTKSFYLVMLVMGVISWSCSTADLSQGTLKSSLKNNVQELNTAMNKISASSGYQVLATSPTSNSSMSSASFVRTSVSAYDSTYNSILLSDIAGIYDYKATDKRGPQSALRIFTKTGTSDLMVVRLPESKVKNPFALMHYSKSDTSLVNDYVISLSKYLDYFRNAHTWDYEMASTINIKNVNAGALAIHSSNSTANGYKYASEFVFTDGYKASCTYASGDTAIATYAINDGSKVLYAEKFTAIKGSKEDKHHERTYSLTIGNVEIVRGMGHDALDSAKVYVSGVLQTNAKIEIVDIDAATADGTDNSVINHKRELKITFDDGTTSTISELLGTSVTTIRTLFASLRQSTFAVSIIDWIAWNIYTNK